MYFIHKRLLSEAERTPQRSKRAVFDREALRQHGTYFLYFHCLSMLISFSYLLAFISCSMVSLVLSCYALNSAEPCAGLVYPIVEILPPPYTLRPPPSSSVCNPPDDLRNRHWRQIVRPGHTCLQTLLRVLDF